MSVKHPIITVTGSSGAGTTTVKHTFDQIFRREGIKSVSIEGDAFHRYNRREMQAENEKRQAEGDHSFSHFSYDANELVELADVFRIYGETGTGQTRTYVHNDAEAELHKTLPGEFTGWMPFEEGSDILFYEGLHGAVSTQDIKIADHADLKIGVVPVSTLNGYRKSTATNHRGDIRRKLSPM